MPPVVKKAGNIQVSEIDTSNVEGKVTVEKSVTTKIGDDFFKAVISISLPLNYNEAQLRLAESAAEKTTKVLNDFADDYLDTEISALRQQQ